MAAILNRGPSIDASTKFDSFGEALSVEKIKKKSPNQKQKFACGRHDC
jgi:hypothetical protein